MKESLYKLKDMICDELDSIADKGSITNDTLEMVDQLTHSLKSIETIIAMEDSGYSKDMYPSRRYSDNRPYLHYSRDTEKDAAVKELRSMLADVSDDKARKALRACISQMEG